VQEVYRVRADGIASETIQGETVVLDLATGAYFSLSAAASVAWLMLQSGSSKPAMAAALKQHYEGGDAAIDAATDAFVAALLQEGVIETVPDAAAEAAAPAPATSRAPFPGLDIQRYTDIQELLLIDPVHEVDDRGWPMRPDQA